MSIGSPEPSRPDPIRHSISLLAPLRTIDLGLEQTFDRLPAAVEITGDPYFLVKDDAGAYRLFSRICPHQGGVVMETPSCFECPQHGWRFDAKTGRGIDVSPSRLTSWPVTVRDGHLWVDLAERSSPVLSDAGARRDAWSADFSLRLVAHAALQIQVAGFTLLTDPWLSGTAFLGSWIPYPPAPDAPDCRPDALWISHEHSDHFSPASLRRFSRTTPVYIPDFPNGRLARALADMGFVAVNRMRFGQPYEIADGVRLTCFEPPGLWNDSILLIEAGGLRLLNINDAGVNHRIASAVGPVDILASAYNPASSYPFAWAHPTSEAKEEITEHARLGMLRMLHQAAKRYQPRYLLPFAAHFTLWHPSHHEYLTQLRRNTLDDVVRAFKHTDIKVLDMLPGGSWHPGARAFDPGPDRTHLFDPGYQMQWVRDTYDEALFAAEHPPAGPLPREAVEAYLMRLNEVPDIAFCEDLSVRLHSGEESDYGRVDVSFEVTGGRLSMRPSSTATPTLTMEVPLAVLRHLVLNDASWDEAHVGFWCRFHRSPDQFHAGFWRLLQAPYYGRSPQLSAAAAGLPIVPTASVADIIERYGEQAQRILSRYGLHCSGCPHAPAENLLLAAERHGVDGAMTQRLVLELSRVFSDSTRRSEAGDGDREAGRFVGV